MNTKYCTASFMAMSNFYNLKIGNGGNFGDAKPMESIGAFGGPSFILKTTAGCVSSVFFKTTPHQKNVRLLMTFESASHEALPERLELGVRKWIRRHPN